MMNPKQIRLKVKLSAIIHAQLNKHFRLFRRPCKTEAKCFNEFYDAVLFFQDGYVVSLYKK